MKKAIKKMSEEELMMAKAVCDFHPFARNSVLIDKGDMKAPDWDAMLDWGYDFLDWDDDEDEGILPQKNMKRMERRKATFRKDKGRQTRTRNLGYNLSPDMTREKVKTLLSSNHSDRMYFRGNKAKKLGKAMTTKTALDLVEQMKWEAEEDKEAERLEAERLFAKAELDNKKFQFDKLDCLEGSLKETVSELIRTIYEANSKLKELEPQLNGLRLAKHYLEVEISKLEEVVNS